MPFAQTNARRPFRVVAVKHADRFSHVYVIGKTGTGKTTLLETLLRRDLENGNGCALIDPHGDFVERVAATTPPTRRADVIYVDVSDPAQPYGHIQCTRFADGSGGGAVRANKRKAPQTRGLGALTRASNASRVQ
ncbi:MAG: DUF87 domain-containing protein [Rhodospirillales bacterium]|nr:DUF87 domain-containing protein [Rhodospirillales bacterium]